MEVTVSKIAHPTGDVLYATPNRTCLWRVESFFTKEPDTLAWIAEMNPGDVLVDVGANVGMYTVWAARTAGARVFGFEPESQNFALLNQNIALNRIDALAYPLALSDSDGAAPLYLSNFEPGGSCHAFGERTDFKGRPMRPVFAQGSIGMRLDEVVRCGVVPPPQHIKIDVDGFEHKVLAGAATTLCAAQTVLVEINTNLPEHRALFATMRGFGFQWDEAQAGAARRTEGAFAGTGNVIFRR